MKKSKYKKRKIAAMHNTDGMRLTSASELFRNMPDYDTIARKKLLCHCRKNTRISWGCVSEGEYVYLMRAKPRKKGKHNMWKVQYSDVGNGFIQLANCTRFDKEGAEENASFIRSHNFPITDVWNLDTAFTLFFLPRLKVFTETTRWGTPVVSKPQDNGETGVHALTEEEWQNILVRMYEGLTLAYDGSDAESIRRRLKQEHSEYDQEQLWNLEFEMEEDGKKLFTQYFFCLWD